MLDRIFVLLHQIFVFGFPHRSDKHVFHKISPSKIYHLRTYMSMPIINEKTPPLHYVASITLQKNGNNKNFTNKILRILKNRLHFLFKFDIIQKQSKIASVAQQVEQLIRNQQVAGPNPATSSKKTAIPRVWRFFMLTSSLRP